MASLKVFSLEGKSLKLDTAEDLEPHIDSLRAMPDVEEVRVFGNTLGVGACKLLGEVLATKKNLQTANLADIFTGRLLNEIPEALSSLLISILNLPKLGTINLNDNAFGLNTVSPLVAFLSAHVPLQHLYLNNNGLGPEAGTLVADALSELHAKKEAARAGGDAQVPHLETVICGRNRLENGSMKAWARCFGLHNRVRVVRMIQNGIRQDGITHLLGHGLSRASGLSVLDLQDNTFTLLGARALAAAAPGWADMVELGVGDSLLGAKGGVLLAQALSQGENPKLEVLRLQYNDITSAGLAALAKAVASDALPKLRRLELNGNKFSEEDENVEKLTELFDARKEMFEGDVIDEDGWGLDELDELESEDEDEEEDDGEDEDKDELDAKDAPKEPEKVIQKVPAVQVKDKEVDGLADMLGKTAI